MAAARFSALQQEVTCSICWEFFTVPVTIECGHNFCSPCISTYWRGTEGSLTCPQCRKECTKTDICKNLQLANLVAIAKQLTATPIIPGELCEWHEEKLKLFCEDDQQAVCTICDRSKEHRGHIVIPIEEALQQYKVKIYNNLDALKTEMADILNLEADGKKCLSEFQEKVERERQKIESEFEEMHHFLEDQKQTFLSQLEEEEKETMKRLEENIAKLSEQSASLLKLITEKEEQCKQSSVHLLKDARSFLERPVSEKPEAVFMELANLSCSVPRQHFVAAKMLKQFKGHGLGDLRIVLIGEETIANRTLETIFHESEMPAPEGTSPPGSTACDKKVCIRSGRSVTLVTTPRLLAGTLSQKELTEEIGQCVVLSAPGPHAIVLVLSLGHFTKAQEEALVIIQDLFGGDAAKYTIVLMAGEDGLKKDERQATFQEHKTKLKEMIGKCGNRFCTLDTSAKGEKPDWQISKLVTMIDKMVLENGGKCYTNPMWEEAEKELQQRADEIKKKCDAQYMKEKSEIRRQYKELIESVKKQPEGPEKEQRLRELESDLKNKLEENERCHEMKQNAVHAEAESKLLATMRGKMDVGGPLGIVIGAVIGKVVLGPLGMFFGGPVGILVGGALGGTVGGAVGGAVEGAVGATVKIFKGLLEM